MPPHDTAEAVPHPCPIRAHSPPRGTLRQIWTSSPRHPLASRLRQRPASTRPDIAILDLQMPHRDGITVATSLREALPNCRSLIVTSHGLPGHLKRALEEGVHGFAPKTVSARDLAQIVRTVRAGDRYIDPVLAADAISVGDSPLSPREADIPAVPARGRHPRCPPARQTSSRSPPTELPSSKSPSAPRSPPAPCATISPPPPSNRAPKIATESSTSPVSKVDLMGSATAAPCWRLNRCAWLVTALLCTAVGGCSAR